MDDPATQSESLFSGLYVWVRVRVSVSVCVSLCVGGWM